MRNFVPGFLACSCVAGAFLLSSAHAAAPVGIPPASAQLPLASHKALYTVSLIATRPGADYLDVSGKMSLEFADKCSVWTTKQKSLLLTIAGDGTEELSRNEFRASENKTGDLYTFYLRQSQDGEATEYQGSATRAGPNGAGVAEYSLPKHATYKLPPHFFFQVAQQIEVIENARKGMRFFSGDMFDGTEGGGASHYNVVVLKPKTNTALEASIKNPLLNSPSHRVRIAFYPPTGTTAASAADGDNPMTGGEEPEYEMTMTLHDNGVVSDYDYDYQDFSVHGKLEAIQALPRPRC